MGIRDIINSLKSAQQMPLISWRVDPYEGIDFIFDNRALAAPEKHAMENPHFGMQLAYLRAMEEQSKAVRNANGFTILSVDAVELGEDFISLFDFADLYSGKFKARFEGTTGKASFDVNIDLHMPDGSLIQTYKVNGPFLKVADNEQYFLSPAQWRALTSVQNHKKQNEQDRVEYENNWLVFQLQIAKKAGMLIDLAHFNDLEIISPEKVGVSIDTLANGDIILTPSFGSGIDMDDTKARLGQISKESGHCIIRIKDKFFLLDEKRIQATQEILTNKRIPKDQVAIFLKTPTAYLDAALIDLDTGFSLRVHGAERFSHRYFGDVEKSGVDWFSKAEGLVEPAERLIDVVDSDEKLIEIEAIIFDAKSSGSQLVDIDNRTFDISNEEEVSKSIGSIKRGLEEGSIFPVEPSPSQPKDESNVDAGRAVVAIDSNDDDMDFTRASRVAGLEFSGQTFAKENLKRQPFPHQEEGISWMLAHLNQISDPSETSGALLADDMGLGKTYMALVAIAEWYRRLKDSHSPLKPTLIVAPLSLIENWQTEVHDTFIKSPFSDIVVLQSDGDLKKFRIKGAGRETTQDFSASDVIAHQDEIRYSLKVGPHYGSDRLDLPSRLVFTTYQTLRDYQFSLSRVDWCVVAFDEAQNLKNPNALATRAAKGMKADFKLLATGTPVENSLKDFWCLMDTAVPGLLGAWQLFRQDYISPILSASIENVGQVRIDIGIQLRARVGHYMLRRTKAEKLKGLPEKRIFSGDEASTENTYMPSLSGVMSGSQLAFYDEIISKVKNTDPEDKRTVILPSLRQLKVTSIHHDIARRTAIPASPKDLMNQSKMSVKVQSLILLLKEIEKRGEKVLVFAETKAVQAYFCALIGTIFKIPVEIINGETKAVATKEGMATRKSIIDRFQSGIGFGVIIMSPVAAGVGLTVVGANNVIHMERHWNPAKEAQATDRVYRIGQKRDVNVYLPMALHPSVRSFDLQLNGLLANKTDLSDAVVANPSIEAADLAGCF